MLESKVGRRLASLTQQQLFADLINDAYKPKMHKIYATYLRGVKVDFALNVRKSPFELRRLEQEVMSILQPAHDDIEQITCRCAQSTCTCKSTLLAAAPAIVLQS